MYKNSVTINTRYYKRKKSKQVNPFHATGLFLYPLKTENSSIPDVFRGYITRPVAWNMGQVLKFVQ